MLLESDSAWSRSARAPRVNFTTDYGKQGAGQATLTQAARSLLIYFFRAAIFALISARRSFGASALAISALIAASIFSIVFNEPSG